MNLHPFLQLARDIVIRVPMGIMPLSPSGIIFWVVALLVWLQYRRLANMEKRIHGFVINHPLSCTATSAAFGIIAGIVGSMVLVYSGVILYYRDIIYLWPAALLLMFINPRFLCFSYAAGLLALAHLAFGWPAHMNVAGIMALVAILHLMEAILVRISGDRVRTPVYLRRKDRQVVGGYLIQRFWPIPIMIIFFMQISPELLGETLQMPDWWPLIEASVPNGADWARILTPVVAALGYSDIAVTEKPRERAHQSARNLCIFSFVLLALSLAISHWKALAWVVAVFSPLGHEAMIHLGSGREMRGVARYTADNPGITIMGVRQGGSGDRLGLQPDDIIISVNGLRVETREDFVEAALGQSRSVNVVVVRNGREMRMQGRAPQGRWEDLHVVAAPEEGDREHVNLAGGGRVTRLVGRFLKWARR